MEESDFTSQMTPGDAERLKASNLRRRPNMLDRLSIRSSHLDESFGDDALDGRDQTQLFQQIIAIIRWGVLGLLIILSGPIVAEGGDEGAVVATLLFGFIALTIVRHARPIQFDQQLRCDLAILGEIALSVAAIALTARWHSPLAVSLTVPIIVAGFARGYQYALRVALLATIVPTTLEFIAVGIELDSLQAVG